MILTFITNALAIFGGLMLCSILGIKIYEKVKEKQLEKAIERRKDNHNERI